MSSNTVVSLRKERLHNQSMAMMWQKIRVAREHAGFTQQQIADVCRISRSAVSQWESPNPDKRTRPDLENLSLFANATKTSLIWLTNDRSDLSDPAAFLSEPVFTVRELPEPTYGEVQEIEEAEAPTPLDDSDQVIPILSWTDVVSWVDAQDPARTTEWKDAVVERKRRGFGTRTYALRMKDDSMTAPAGPSLSPGLLVIVDPDISPFDTGFVVTYLRGAQEPTLRQLVSDGLRSYLKPLNSQYPMTDVTEYLATDQMVHCGVVREGRLPFGDFDVALLTS